MYASKSLIRTLSFVGAAEELCRLFSIDNDIDMTPILRKSKESARQQRLRPQHERSNDIPHTRPIAERFPSSGPTNNRKRPYARDAGYNDTGTNALFPNCVKF